MRGKLFLLSKCFKKKKKKRDSQRTNGKNSARANMACVQKKKKRVCVCSSAVCRAAVCGMIYVSPLLSGVVNMCII